MLGGGPIKLPRPQNRAGEFRLVRRIRKMLRLQAKAFMLFEAAGTWSAIEKIAAIKLHARLRRIDLHHPPARRLFHAGGQLQLSRLAAKDETVVVALRLVRLLFEL